MKEDLLLQEAYKKVNRYAEFINECTSIATSVGGSLVMCKNRDRAYYPKLKVVRELINGIECVYMYDDDTDYSEGMNEKGIGILNTTLTGKKDEKEGSCEHKVGRKINKDGYKIRTALGHSDINKIIEILDLFDRGLGGHTTVGFNGGIVTIEKLAFGKPIIHKHDKHEVIVRANHGIGYPDQGYQEGEDRESSLSRVFYATQDARKSTTPDELLLSLRTHHADTMGYLEPYRTNYKVWTSSQIMLNLTGLTFDFVVDENVNFVGIENRLPKGYLPKIGVRVHKLETVFKVR